jgi:hypothetical protein
MVTSDSEAFKLDNLESEVVEVHESLPSTFP